MGVDSENKKIRKFHASIEDGKLLMLVYARKRHRSRGPAQMREKYPEAEGVGTDTHFVNPFSSAKPAPDPSSPTRNCPDTRGTAVMALAVVLILLVAGSLAFHFPQPVVVHADRRPTGLRWTRR